MKNSFLLFASTLFIIGIAIYVGYHDNLIVFIPMLLLFPFFINPFPLKMTYVYLLGMFAFTLLFWSLMNLEFYNHVSDELNTTFRRKSFFNYAVFVFIFLFYLRQRELFSKSVEYALWFFVLLWYVQLIGFYATGEYLDVLEPILGPEFAQRYQAYFIQSSLPIDVIRPTSFFQEPGTYATSTFPLLALSYIKSKKLTNLHILVLISYIGSLSLFGIMIAILFLLVVEISSFKFKFSKRNIFIFIIFTLLGIGLISYLYFRFVLEGGMEQVGYRGAVLDFWLSQDSRGLLFGLGHAQTMFTNRVMINDATFFFKLMFEYGLFALPYVLLMAYISRGVPIFFFLIILLTKLHYHTYIVWLFAAGIILLWKDSEEFIRVEVDENRRKF